MLCTCVSVAQTLPLSSFRENGKCEVIEFQNGVKVVVSEAANDIAGIKLTIDPATVAGKRLTLHGETNFDVASTVERYTGAKIRFDWSSGSKPRSGGGGVGFGTGRKENYAFSGSVDIPYDAKSVYLSIGIQKSTGSFELRNLVIEIGKDTLLNLENFANMGYADDIAGDGKGGWCDQGPSNDARHFYERHKEYAGVPFHVILRGRNDGKAVATFTGHEFPNPLEKIRFDLNKTDARGEILSLLHASNFCSENNDRVGIIELVGINGGKQEIPVVCKRDIWNWRSPIPQDNCLPAAIWNTPGGERGVFRSDFRIDPKLGKLASITFRKGESQANWLLLGATLCVEKYSKPPLKTYRFTGDYRPIAQSAGTQVKKGSILDLSFLTVDAPAGSKGRVIRTPAGLLAFEKEPGTTVRFAASNNMAMFLLDELKDKASIERFAEEYVRTGYNMIRLHFTGEAMLQKATVPLDFDPEMLDRLEYLIAQLKKHGIYINWDVMCGRVGFLPQSAAADASLNYKLNILFNPEVRANWAAGLRKLLTHRNPYTGLTLIEDPVLAMIVCYNEQEIPLVLSAGKASLAQGLPRWREFLRTRYGSIDAWQKAWGKATGNCRSFEDIPILTPQDTRGKDRRSVDVAEFLNEVEAETFAFFLEELRKINYRGLVSNYNLGRQLRYTFLRSAGDFAAMNGYFAHPQQNRRAVPGHSSLPEGAPDFRSVAAIQIAGLPMVVTEHGHGFWNRYRYEHAFTMGGYGSLQDFSGITTHSHPLTFNPKPQPIRTFVNYTDPVVSAGELLLTLLYRRGDFKPSESIVHFQLDRQTLFQPEYANNALDDKQQYLALLTRINQTGAGNVVPAASGGAEMTFPALGSAGIELDAVGGAGAVRVLAGESTFSLPETIRAMKEKGLLPRDNRTDPGNGIYESSTGELYMDTGKKYLMLDSPRTQGICAPAGSAGRMRDFEVRSMTVNGCVAASAMDGEKSLRDAGRVLISVITNAVNSGMTFDDEALFHVQSFGSPPVLWECGKFSLALRNRNTSMKCFALGLDGERRSEIPITVGNGVLEIEIDTTALPNGPAVFFELVTSGEKER